MGSGVLNSGSHALETSLWTAEPSPWPLYLCCGCHRLCVGFSNCVILLTLQASDWGHFRLWNGDAQPTQTCPELCRDLQHISLPLEGGCKSWLSCSNPSPFPAHCSHSLSLDTQDHIVWPALLGLFFCAHSVHACSAWEAIPQTEGVEDEGLGFPCVHRGMSCVEVKQPKRTQCLGVVWCADWADF